MSYREDFEKWVKDNNVKIGDEVKIVNIHKPSGWVNDWVDEMKYNTGKTFKIISLEHGSSGGLKLDEYIYPYTCIEIIGKNEPSTSYQERFQKWKKDNNVKIGDEIVIDTLLIHSDCPGISLNSINPGEKYTITGFSDNFIRITVGKIDAYYVPFECVELIKNTPKVSLTSEKLLKGFTDELPETIEEYKWSIPLDSHEVSEYGDRSNRKSFYGISGKIEPREYFLPKHFLTKKEKSKILNFLNNDNEIYRTSETIPGGVEGNSIESSSTGEQATISGRYSGNGISYGKVRARTRSFKKSKKS